MSSSREHLLKIIKNAPELPGVYLFKNMHGAILYVGKAKNLKKRLLSYMNDKKLERRKRIMVHSAADVEFIVVDSEVSALVLENNMIKENQPHYNVSLKDGKTFPYIKVTMKEDFPKVYITRMKKNDGSLYFGPYTSVTTLREFMWKLRALFPFRHCGVMPKTVCLQYHLRRCQGPCEGKINKEHYRIEIQKILSILRGNAKELYLSLERDMKQAATELRFEDAARLRDQLDGLRQIIFMPGVEHQSKEENKDYCAVVTRDGKCGVCVFKVRGGKVLERVSEVFDTSETECEVLSAFLTLHYRNQALIPAVIVVSDLDETVIQVAERIERGYGIKPDIVQPKNEYDMKMMAMVVENAVFAIQKHFLHSLDAQFERLAEVLGLDEVLSIDAFDISNYGKELFVGACIRIERGGFNKRLYRKFSIAATAQNDFQMMAEITGRRYKEKKDLPDLILIDGGPVQVAFAIESLAKIGVEIPLVGLAKREETIITKDGTPLRLSKDDAALLLLMKARDEVHRFGITYSRTKKRKKNVSNPLRDIPGLGAKKADMILTFFGSLDNVRTTTIDDLCKVPGIGKETAQKIREFIENTSD